MPPYRSGMSRLMVGAPEYMADMLYATRFWAPDEVIWFQKGGKTYMVLSPLEIGRASKQAKADVLIPYREYEQKLENKLKRPVKMQDVLVEVLEEYGIGCVEVPYGTSVGVVKCLERKGIRVSVTEEAFFPERQYKTTQEIQWIRQAQKVAEQGMYRAEEILKAAKIDKRKYIIWAGKKLTSEILRGEIDAAVIREGGLPAGTIVAGGVQGCDPHERGSGPLKAHQTIIVDIFPRNQKTGYFGDLTRTFVKGEASPQIRKLYRTVLRAQKMALEMVKPGVRGQKIHQAIHQFFKEEGYSTEQRKGSWVGFFHGTGHGVGLEIHEYPRVQKAILRSGHVITIEPGLYYPEIGGVRIEDLVAVSGKGVMNLTKIRKSLIP